EAGNKKIVYEEDGVQHELPADTRVPMNFWGFTPKVFDIALTMFPKFVEENGDNPKDEFFIPSIPTYMVRNGLICVSVILNSSKWFDESYPDDIPIVQESISGLIASGAYPEKLF